MLGSVPRNHPSRVKKRGADDAIDDRETPPDVFDPLNAEFGFTLDVAAARHNSKCRRYYALRPGSPLVSARQGSLFPDVFVGDPEALAYNGLEQEWEAGEVIWCNPPFSDIEPWVAKAHNAEATVVMLLPANRTEQPWWQRYVEQYRDGKDGLVDAWSGAAGGCPETRFLAGRRCFRNRGAEIGNRTSRNPPFGIVIVIWDRRSS